MSIVSLADVKTYLGLTGTGDDQLISSCIVAAQARIEQDTGRTFAYSSNVTRTYSTDGSASLLIRDVPWAASSNTIVVRLTGATLTYGSGYWFLPDRRNPDVSVTIQLRMYDRTRPDWYKVNPDWWDGNMDSPRYAYALGSPNDLIIDGPEGHPNPAGDVVNMCKVMAALLYWQAKSGASGTITTPTGETIDLTQKPIGYDEFVRSWAVKTAVADV
jgi:hypothetical protein